MYKAEDTRLGRFVALKFLPQEGQRDAQVQARFQREAQAASALNHHNICTVYDIGEQDGQTFIAMELLEGQTLKQKIGSRPLPVETLLDYAMQIAAGLEIAHKNGIVHRDIKPSNIFVTSLGAVKLADFGLAKRVILNSTPIGESPTISASITERGTIVGTVAYMSPEQAQDKDIDARSDIFSFGIVLYEMATGKQAFPGESPATIIGEILHKAPKSICELNPQVPEELQRIVVKALEKDREDRYQSAHELMVDLRRLDEEGDGTVADRLAGRVGKAREVAEVDVDWGGSGRLRRRMACVYRPRHACRFCATADGTTDLFGRNQKPLDLHGRIAYLFRQQKHSRRNVRKGGRHGASPSRDRHHEYPGYFAGWL